ncbi:MAG: amidohydrolase [Hyphomonadaceae bacterium]|nr:amidohydrolase [Hyphomonadaceae bacterium]
MLLSRRAFALSSAAFAAGCVTPQADEAGIILRGRIHTGVAARPLAEAVLVRGKDIAFVGAFDAARRRAAGAQVIEIGEAAAFPGFVDSHVHLPDVGLMSMRLDLTGVGSVAELKTRLASYAAARPEGPIVGAGWIETHWPEARFPTRDDLDAVVRERPVFLERADGHAAAANSAALALAGIGDGAPDPAGGRIERDARRRATGMLIDAATALVRGRLPPVSRADEREALKAAARLYASRGWTGVANMGASLAQAEDFDALAAAGELPLKADLYIGEAEADAFLAAGPSVDATGLVNRRGIKLYMDGALGSRGAALLLPYADAPGDGLIVTPPERLKDVMARARVANAQIALHAIGDRANRLGLDFFAETFADAPEALRAARWRIEHAQVIDHRDLPRFGRMGVIASMQPSHAISDLYFAPSRLGDARLSGAYAWKSLLNYHATICGGSDAPVEKGDPLIEFYAATWRHSLDGFAGPDWRLQETVSRTEALAMLTTAGAYATFQERTRGTIEPGKRADISVFSADLMSAPFDAIPKARAVLTMSEGRITHSAL